MTFDGNPMLQKLSDPSVTSDDAVITKKPRKKIKSQTGFGDLPLEVVVHIYLAPAAVLSLLYGLPTRLKGASPSVLPNTY